MAMELSFERGIRDLLGGELTRFLAQGNQPFDAVCYFALRPRGKSQT